MVGGEAQVTLEVQREADLGGRTGSAHGLCWWWVSLHR